MKNYKNSSYAANKYSKDIVYNSEISGSTSITLDDFLKSDPTLTKADFEFWKNWSDEDYRVESKETNNQTKKDVSFTSLDEVVAGVGLSLEEQYEEDECERIYLTAVREAMRRFLNDKSISSTTKERFRLHFINGERVNFMQVWDYNADGSMTFNLLYTFEKNNEIYRKEKFDEHYHNVSKELILNKLHELGYSDIQILCFPSYFTIKNFDETEWYTIFAKKN